MECAMSRNCRTKRIGETFGCEGIISIIMSLSESLLELEIYIVFNFDKLKVGGSL